MYQALYRKYRPNNFDSVYGQDEIVSVLQNEVKNNRISHAYLFCGTRGTGKTTCAKIFAKAVNCLSPKDGNPCNECEICKGIDDGSILDVVEMDAASNNGINDVRDIRDEVVYTPAKARFRVYIIDEVHMMSPAAFNALLKTLEQPPVHVVFILATTEAHKIPATISSRCQRFYFKRIDGAAAGERLAEIAAAEGVTLLPGAANQIIRLADGSLRDAVSILDQCAIYDRELTAEKVAQICGAAGTGDIASLASFCAAGDFEGAIAVFEKIYKDGGDVGSVCGGLLTAFRDILLQKTLRNPAELLSFGAEDAEKLKTAGEAVSAKDILEKTEIIADIYDKLSVSANKKTIFEIGLLAVCGKA